MNGNDTIASIVRFFLNNDVWLFIGALFLLPNGVWGLIVGRTIFWSSPAPTPGDHQAKRLERLYPRVPLFVYQGRGLAAVETIVGACLGGLFALGRLTPPLIVTKTETIIGLFVVGVGAVVFVFLFFTHKSGDQDQTPTANHPTTSHPQPVKAKDLLSLSAAAQVLNLPEPELQQMAENGGITAHHINGTYMFDRPSLAAFNEAMQVLKQR